MPTINTFDVLNEPVSGLRFTVDFMWTGQGLESMQFSKISGLEDESETMTYREGSDPLTLRKFPGLSTFPRVVMEHGVSRNRTLEAWRRAIIDFGLPFAGGGAGVPQGIQAPNEYRSTVIISLYDGQADDSDDFIRQWTLLRAWPAALKVADLDATTSGILIESVEFEHEGLITRS